MMTFLILGGNIKSKSPYDVEGWPFFEDSKPSISQHTTVS